MQKTWSPIPRQTRILLGVGIAGEEISVGVEGEIVGVAQTRGDEVYLGGIRWTAGNPASGRRQGGKLQYPRICAR